MSFPDPSAMEPETRIEAMSYEQAFAALEVTLAALESEQQTLDDAMKLFERGQMLVKHCMDLLDQADLKVRQLSGGEFTDFSPQA